MTEPNPQQDERLNALLRGPLWEGLSPDERQQVDSSPKKTSVSESDLLKAMRTIAKHLADIQEDRIEEERSAMLGFANMIAELRDRITIIDERISNPND